MRITTCLLIAVLQMPVPAAFAQPGDLVTQPGDLVTQPGDLVTQPGDLVTQSGDLVDRTLAIVGTQVITLGDARAAIGLGLVEAERTADPLSVTQQLVDRELVLREVQRYAPPAPSESAVDARMDEVSKTVSSPAELQRVLDETGFTETRLRAWLRDDLRTIAYLAQRFASASTPTDNEISAAFAQQRAEFDRTGTSFQQAAPVLRERLVASRRRELISDWVSDLRRRTEVTILGQ